MTGIGYCEFEGCRNRTSRGYCREHNDFIKRRKALEENDSRHFMDKFFGWVLKTFKRF